MKYVGNATKILGLLIFPALATAQEMVPITISASHPTAVPWVGALQTFVVEPSNARLEEMGSDYRIEWTEAFGGSLYDFNETLEAVETGLTDMGWVGALWEGSKMPLQNVMFSTPFVTSDPVLAVEVLNEMNATIPARNTRSGPATTSCSSALR